MQPWGRHGVHKAGFKPGVPTVIWMRNQRSTRPSTPTKASLDTIASHMALHQLLVFSSPRLKVSFKEFRQDKRQAPGESKGSVNSIRQGRHSP